MSEEQPLRDWLASLVPAHYNEPSECNVCGDVGLHAMNAAGESRCDICLAKEERETAARLAAAQLEDCFSSWPARHRVAALTPQAAKNWVARPELFGRAKEYVNSPKVVFMGAAGRGKTTLAALMAGSRTRDALRAGKLVRPPVFVHAARIGSARMRHADDEIEAVLRARFVLIDDVGNESNTPSNPLREVLLERHADDKPTWITTPFARAEVVTRYGDGIARRIFEDAIVFDLGQAT